MIDIYVGDCRDVMRSLAAESVDAIVTDPPYELGFMGKAWDRSGVAFDVSMWAEALRVAKPGAWLAAFGGTRTYHRLACAIEDAGWQLRDSIVRMHDGQETAVVALEDCPWLAGWVYGSGFPKSRNGPWGGTALKPAWEPIVLARKPLAGTVSKNFERYGTGGINIHACRIESSGGRVRADEESQDRTYAERGGTDFAMKPGPRGGDPLGRWPANLIHDGSDAVRSAFPIAPGQQGDLRQQDHVVPKGNAYGQQGPRVAHVMRGDTGGADRFFYCAKASREDRDEGCDDHPLTQVGMVSNTSGQHVTRRDGNAPGLGRNDHPTVKPFEVMRWICRLVCPPGGTVLDHFTGSGSTGKAAHAEGMGFVGIEKERRSALIAVSRINGKGSIFNVVRFHDSDHARCASTADEAHASGERG